MHLAKAYPSNGPSTQLQKAMFAIPASSHMNLYKDACSPSRPACLGFPHAMDCQSYSGGYKLILMQFVACETPNTEHFDLSSA